MKKFQEARAAAIALLIGTGGLTWWASLPGRHADAGEILIADAPEPPRPTATASPANPVARAQPSGIAPQIEARIIADSGDPGAQLRAVKLAGDRQQIACGEIAGSSGRQYVRFIWFEDIRKTISEDSRGTYAQFALLCDGKGMAGP